MRAIGVSRAKDSISRLRFEYSLLLECLEKKNSTLSFPNLKEFTPADIDAESIESLSLDDITSLLASTPLELAEIKRKLPNLLGGLISERQQQFVNNSTKTTTVNQPANSRSRRKRGVANGAAVSSKKRVRDPREPKRPTNAYLFFCDAERERVKSEWAQSHPEEHIDLSRAMTDVWRTMTDVDKKPYFEMYEKDKERYHKAVEQYATIKEQERLAESQGNAANEPSASASVEPDADTPTDSGLDVETPVENDLSHSENRIDNYDGLKRKEGDHINSSGRITKEKLVERDEQENEEEEHDDEDEAEDRDDSRMSINQGETDQDDIPDSEDPQAELNSDFPAAEEDDDEEDPEDFDELDEEEAEERLDEEDAHSAEMTDGVQDEDAFDSLKSDPDVSFN